MSAPKNPSLKCSQVVRGIPLERYRLPNDGRKWKQAARSRSDLLLRLSSYANGDGTFVRNGRNYSPSAETILKHVGHGSYYRLADDLRAVGLLSWTREKHYERRIYTIRLPEQVSDSPKSPTTFNEKQVPDSQITGPTFASEGQNQVPHSQITGPTVDTIRLYPSKEPSKEREPSLPSAAEKPTPLSPSGDSTAKAAGKEKHITVDDIVAFIIKPRKRGTAQVSKTAKNELHAALASLQKEPAPLGWSEMQEMERVIKDKLALCTDAFSLSTFGTSLDAELIPSIRNLREEWTADWDQDFEKFKNANDVTPSKLRAWLKSHPAPDKICADISREALEEMECNEEETEVTAQK